VVYDQLLYPGVRHPATLNSQPFYHFQKFSDFNLSMLFLFLSLTSNFMIMVSEFHFNQINLRLSCSSFMTTLDPHL
jgi:hypothetical protein